LARLQQQDGQHAAFLPAADPDGGVAIDDFDRTEQAELHADRLYS
jgi:hypothetical protein